MKNLMDAINKLHRINQMSHESIVNNYFSNITKFSVKRVEADFELLGMNISPSAYFEASQKIYTNGFEKYVHEGKLSFDALIEQMTKTYIVRSWKIFFEYEILKQTNVKQLAKKYGVSETRIRQIMKAFKRHVVKRYFAKKFLERIYNHLDLGHDISFLEKEKFSSDPYVYYGQNETEIYGNLALTGYFFEKKIILTDKYFVVLPETYASIDDYLSDLIQKNFEEGKLYNINFEKHHQILGIPIAIFHHWLTTQNNILCHNNSFYYRCTTINTTDKCKFILSLHGAPMLLSDIFKSYTNLFNEATSQRVLYTCLQNAKSNGALKMARGLFWLEEE